MIALGFVVAAAIGSVGRYTASAAMPGNAGTAVATLYVNIAGSLLAGLLATRPDDTRTIVAIGALGAFTTFSTFVLVATHHLDEGNHRAAVSYLVTTVVACVGAAWLGLTAAQQGWT